LTSILHISMSKDDGYSCPPYETSNMIAYPRTQSYTQWFRSPINHFDYNPNEVQTSASHGDYIRYFYNHILSIIKDNHMNINNEKEFKKEIATFIYKLSDENRECLP